MADFNDFDIAGLQLVEESIAAQAAKDVKNGIKAMYRSFGKELNSDEVAFVRKVATGILGGPNMNTARDRIRKFAETYREYKSACKYFEEDPYNNMNGNGPQWLERLKKDAIAEVEAENKAKRTALVRQMRVHKTQPRKKKVKEDN